MANRNAGVIGCGRFGALWARFLSEDFNVKCFDKRSLPPPDNARIQYGGLEEAASCELVFVCVPIVEFERAILEALPHFRSGATVVDVASVKLHPHAIMRKHLPPDVHGLPAHPMFGPDSAAKGLAGLPFVLCNESDTSPQALERMRAYLTGRGLKVLEMTCDEHDRITAYSICVTQLIGRVMDRVGIESSPIDTANFSNLLQMRRIAANDTFELFRGLQTLNPYASEMRSRLRSELDELERLLEAK